MSGEGQKHLDSRAIELSAATAAALEHHIAGCEKRDDRRYQESRDARAEANLARAEIKAMIETVHTRVNRLNGRHLFALYSVITLLLGVIGYLLANAPPWTQDVPFT